MNLRRRGNFDLENPKESLVPWWTSCRLTLAGVTFFGAFCLYAMRSCMGVALVCMTTDPNATTTARPDAYTFYQSLGDGYQPNTKEGEFDWSRGLRGWVHSSFYVGYLATQLPGGWFSNKVGAKVIIGGGMLMLSVLTLLTPVAARLSVYLLMVVQAGKGFASGVYFPAQYQLMGRWMPPHERTFLMAVCGAGVPIGTVTSSILSGYLCEHGYAGGWPSIFYTFGAFSVVWCVVWYFMAFSSPQEHPRISLEEADYIKETLPSSSKTKSLHVPWKALLSTVPLYSIIVASACFSWCWFVALSFLPQYMKDVLETDIESNGLYSALPYLSNALLAIVASVFADLIISKSVMSLTHTRKLFQTIGVVPSSAFAVWVAYLTSEQATLAIVLLTLWVGFMTFIKSGSFVNQVDMAAGYAGIIMGIDNTISAIPGIIAPPIVSAMTKSGAVEEWQRVFFVSAGIYMFGWLVYMIFGDAREQKWARTEPDMELEVQSSKNVTIDNLAFVGSYEDMTQTGKADTDKT